MSMIGLEPIRRIAEDFESTVSANSTTSTYFGGCNVLTEPPQLSFFKQGGYMKTDNVVTLPGIEPGNSTLKGW